MLGQLPQEIVARRDAQRAADQRAADEAEDRAMRRRRLDYEGERLQNESDERAAKSAKDRALSDALRTAKTPYEVANAWEQYDSVKGEQFHKRNRQTFKELVATVPDAKWGDIKIAAGNLLPPEFAGMIPDAPPTVEGRRALLQGLEGQIAEPKTPDLVETPDPTDPTKSVWGPKKEGGAVWHPPPPPKAPSNPTEASLAFDAQNPDPKISGPAKAALQALRNQRPSTGSSVQPDGIDAIADAIISGDQPPVLQGLYGKTADVRAALAKKGYNLSDAQTDWQAMQRFTATLNGAQQTRLRQATEFVKETVPLVRELSTDLSKKIPRSKFPILNAAALAAAKSGAMGAEAQAAATTLGAQIADMQSELAVMYRGGNASTDEALKKAGEMLKGNWSESQLEAALKLIERNATIRLNSIRNTGVAGANGGDNRYAPPAAPAQAPPPTSSTPQRMGPWTYTVEP